MLGGMRSRIALGLGPPPLEGDPVVHPDSSSMSSSTALVRTTKLACDATTISNAVRAAP